MTVLQNAMHTAGTVSAGHGPCQADGTLLAEQAGTDCVGKERANTEGGSGSDGGSEVRTLSESRDREKIGELLAVAEQRTVGVEPDSVGQFLAIHEFEPGLTLSVTMADLYRMYEAWSGTDGEAPKRFVRLVHAAGFRRGPRLAPGKRESYALLMGKAGALVASAWADQHPAEFEYGKKFRTRMLKGGK